MEKNAMVEIFERKPDDKRFTLTINVFENCINFSLIQEPGKKLTIYEIIGVLDAIKSRYTFDQSMRNRWEALVEKEKSIK